MPDDSDRYATLAHSLQHLVELGRQHRIELSASRQLAKHMRFPSYFPMFVHAVVRAPADVDFTAEIYEWRESNQLARYSERDVAATNRFHALRRELEEAAQFPAWARDGGRAPPSTRGVLARRRRVAVPE